jgi:hypothetical protein
MTPSAANPAGPSGPSSPREARLRPEYAPLYPGVPADTWMPAATLAGQLLGGMVGKEGKQPMIDPRRLDDGHFEFRGGEPGGAPRRHSRATDVR